jgi:hypothetical protein
MFKSFKIEEPQVFKYLNGNMFEDEVFARFPELREKILPMKE